MCLLTCDHISRNKNIHYEQGSRKFSLGRTKQIGVKHTAKYFLNTYTVTTTYRSKEAPGFQISHDHKHCVSVLRLDGDKLPDWHNVAMSNSNQLIHWQNINVLGIHAPRSSWLDLILIKLTSKMNKYASFMDVIKAKSFETLLYEFSWI